MLLKQSKIRLVYPPALTGQTDSQIIPLILGQFSRAIFVPMHSVISIRLLHHASVDFQV